MRLIATVVVVLAPVVLTQPVRAQEPVPDTTSAWRYFPLEVGNVWEFRVEGGLIYEGGHVVLRVVGDSLVAGQTYHLLQSNRYSNISGADPANPRLSLIRFDTTSAFPVYRSGDGTEQAWAPPDPYTPQLPPWPPLSRLPCRLDAPFGAEITCAGVGPVLTGGGYEAETDFGVQTAVKTLSLRVSEIIPVGQTHTYGADIGPLDFFAEEGGTNRLRLQFARVGGVEYGEPSGVAAEEGPSEVAVALAVFPNPASEAATLTLTLDRPRRVAVAVGECSAAGWPSSTRACFRPGNTASPSTPRPSRLGCTMPEWGAGVPTRRHLSRSFAEPSRLPSAQPAVAGRPTASPLCLPHWQRLSCPPTRSCRVGS